MSDHESVRALLALSAAGLLDPDEERLVREHVCAVRRLCARNSRLTPRCPQGYRACRRRSRPPTWSAGPRRWLPPRPIAGRAPCSPAGPRFLRVSSYFWWGRRWPPWSVIPPRWRGSCGPRFPPCWAQLAPWYWLRAAVSKGALYDARCSPQESDTDGWLDHRRCHISAGISDLQHRFLSARITRPVPVRIIVPVLFPLLLAGYALLIGYVYGDARRRGMRYVMWTLLAIFLFNGIGIILYFILREPLMVYCSRCGAGRTAQSRILPALRSGRAARLPRRVTARSSPAGLTAPGAEISCKTPPSMGYNP